MHCKLNLIEVSPKCKISIVFGLWFGFRRAYPQIKFGISQDIEEQRLSVFT